MERPASDGPDGGQQSSGWDQTQAAVAARAAGIATLTDDHWRVLHALRDLFAEYQAAPTIVQIHERTGFDAKAIDRLFGNPYVAWRIAGLPHPGEEAEAYLRNQ